MNYAIVTHVPTYVGQSPGVVRVSAAFRDDLLAQAAALGEARFSLTLATPRHVEPDAKSLARERFVDVRLADHGIADAPLPAYRTMRQFLAAKSKLERAIAAAARGAAVVQLGAGGHPMALGQFAWPLVDPRDAKRVFVFADDPLPGRRRAVMSGRNPAKRLAKGLALRAFDAFCRQAVAEADLVFAHDPAVPRRFARVWNARCHTFVASPVGDDQLTTIDALADRDTIDPQKPLRLLAEASAAPTAGVEHVERAVAKARRLGAAVQLKLVAPVTEAVLDEADLFVAASLVPGENDAIFLAAARGVPMVCYGGGAADAALAAAGGGRRVERGDADGLAQAVLDFARDRPTLSAAARDALAWAIENTRDAVHRRRAALVRRLLRS